MNTFKPKHFTNFEFSKAFVSRAATDPTVAQLAGRVILQRLRPLDHIGPYWTIVLLCFVQVAVKPSSSSLLELQPQTRWMALAC